MRSSQSHKSNHVSMECEVLFTSDIFSKTMVMSKRTIQVSPYQKKSRLGLKKHDIQEIFNQTHFDKEI